MCGFIWAKLPFRPTEEQLSAAAKFVATRGPSSTSSELRSVGGSYIFFAHYLLDVSGRSAVQPVHWPSAASPELSLLFNGEIYNYRELCADASSDTEALIPLFRTFGAGLWPRLDGEYAIVIYDQHSDQLHVAADQFLTKPLAVAFCVETGAFGVASYPSALEALGFKSPFYFEPNSYAEFKLADPLSWADSTQISKQRQTRDYSLKQYETSFDAWEQAFLSSVRKRASHGTLPLFVPLSSGYDSGAICLALNLLGLPYSTITVDAQEHSGIIQQRIAINRTGSCRRAIKVRAISARGRQSIRNAIAEDCEPFQYMHENITLLDDDGSLGAYRVAQVAKKEGTYVCLSGCGADEIISDYGYNGEKFYLHSEFGGLFPDELEGFFPWKKVYGDSMRSYLFKDELIFGLFGIEGRYPFLDPIVVQAFLNLTPALKNSNYKAPIAAFLRRHCYPFEPGVKRGFSPSRADFKLSWIRRLRQRAGVLKRSLHDLLPR